MDAISIILLNLNVASQLEGLFKVKVTKYQMLSVIFRIMSNIAIIAFFTLYYDRYNWLSIR